MKNRISSFCLSALSLALLLSSSVLTQHRESNPSESAPTDNLGRRGRFIAAFDWLVERSPEFVWPFESMRPAPYDSVRMVVERMPRVVDGKRKEQKSDPLIASRHLKINGRLQKPVRSVRRPVGGRESEQQEFLVKLEQGRLRLTLRSLPGKTFDPEHRVIRVKLFEASIAHQRRAHDILDFVSENDFDNLRR